MVISDRFTDHRFGDCGRRVLLKFKVLLEQGGRLLLELLGLDKDAVLERVGGGQHVLVVVHGVGVEHVAQDGDEELGHAVLLAFGAVVLDGEDEGELGGVEGVGLHGVDQDLLEVELGGEGPAVVDDWFVSLAIPTI